MLNSRAKGEKYVYVMDTESRDMLVDRGFELLKANDKHTVWVFINKPELTFDTIDIPCVVSDVLTF